MVKSIISVFLFFILTIILYRFFKWVFNNYKYYNECLKKAKGIIESEKEREAELKGKTIEEIDSEYNSMDNKHRLYLEQQKQKKIKELASEMYYDYIFSLHR